MVAGWSRIFVQIARSLGMNESKKNAGDTVWSRGWMGMVYSGWCVLMWNWMCCIFKDFYNFCFARLHSQVRFKAVPSNTTMMKTAFAISSVYRVVSQFDFFHVFLKIVCCGMMWLYVHGDVLCLVTKSVKNLEPTNLAILSHGKQTFRWQTKRKQNFGRLGVFCLLPHWESKNASWKSRKPTKTVQDMIQWWLFWVGDHQTGYL
jgi:hypothetical protein